MVEKWRRCFKRVSNMFSLMMFIMLKNVVGFQKSKALFWNRCFGLKTDLPLSHFRTCRDWWPSGPRRPRHVQRFDAPWVADRAPHLGCRRLDADDWIKQIKHIQSVSPHYIGNSETQPTLILTPFWTASNGKRDLFTIPPTIVQNHFF